MMMGLLLSLAYVQPLGETEASNVHYWNLPVAHVSSSAFDPENTPKDEEERLYRACNEELTSERRKLVRLGVTKFVKDPRNCEKKIWNPDKATYSASLVFLADQD